MARRDLYSMVKALLLETLRSQLNDRLQKENLMSTCKKLAITNSNGTPTTTKS
nr:hypothetical protein [Mycoplasmopsis bovis]